MNNIKEVLKGVNVICVYHLERLPYKNYKLIEISSNEKCNIKGCNNTAHYHISLNKGV